MYNLKVYPIIIVLSLTFTRIRVKYEVYSFLYCVPFPAHPLANPKKNQQISGLIFNIWLHYIPVYLINPSDSFLFHNEMSRTMNFWKHCINYMTCQSYDKLPVNEVPGMLVMLFNTTTEQSNTNQLASFIFKIILCVYHYH